MLLALVFVFSVLFIPVQAADTAGVAVSGTISLDDLDSNPDVIVSYPMTFTENDRAYGKKCGYVI